MNEPVIEHFGRTVTSDLLEFMVGDKIGSGCYREVYEFTFNKDYVLKVELGARHFCNIAEWDIWANFKGTRLEKWLCPCRDISPCGSVLMMRRAQPLLKMPARVPGIFADLKAENWGMLDGRPVCVDYGNHAIYTLAAKHAAMKSTKARR